MKRRTVLGAAGGLVLLGGGGYLGVELFAPERSTQVNEDRTAGTADGADAGDDSVSLSGEGTAGGGGHEVLKRGEFVGKANHRCEGTVDLVRDESGLFLQFRDYEQTPGPDVFCYLTPADDPDTTAEIEAGRKILIDGGADGGELTKTGTFAQPLPDDVDVDATGGVGVWCDRFSVPFGAATLSAPG
jgi:hypothetical protein